jgi:transposase
MTTRKRYPTDLTDQQWEQIEPLLPKRRDPRGRQATHSRRELLNAILYLTRNGCSWEALPHDFPPPKTVSDYYYDLCHRGAWERIVDALRRKVRQAAGREAEPRIVVLDSQAVKTTEKGGRKGTTAING